VQVQLLHKTVVHSQITSAMSQWKRCNSLCKM